MAPIRRKKCCVPYCNNVQDISKKQFFKIGANLEDREKWLSSVGKTIAAKSQILHCCEDHFDLPNDAENYIRCKYLPGSKLKLRPNVLPQKKLPINVCRLCLNLIFNMDDFVDISEKGGKNAQIIAATLPELDLSVTVEPVACVKCFNPLEQYYRVKQNALNSEVVVVNCIKSIVKRSPTRLIKDCEIDLFEEYNDILEILEKGKETNKAFYVESKVAQDGVCANEEIEESTEDLIIQIEEQDDDKHPLEGAKMENNLKSSHLRTLLEGESLVENAQENVSVMTSLSHSHLLGSTIETSHYTLKNVESYQNTTTSLVNHTENVKYEVLDPMRVSTEENIYIHVDKQPPEDLVVVTS